MPSRMPSMVTRIALILAGLVLPATPGEARRAPDDDLDADDIAFRRQYERDEKKMIRELVREWTWAAMPPVGFDEDDEPRGSDGSPVRPFVSVTALAAAASGDAIVGGALGGRVRLGATMVGTTHATRGFIARVDRAGRFRMVRLAERETSRVPSALAVDRAGLIVVSYEQRALVTIAAGGRALWSRDLPAARALAFAPNGDILAAGCNIDVHRKASMTAKITYEVRDVTAGYVARISPAGEIRWMYRLDRGQQDLFYRPNDRAVTDCATGIATAPDGDIYVAGHFGRSLRPGQVDEPGLPPAGSFLGRFSADGQLRWSRLVAAGFGAVSLASVADGNVVVVAGQVALTEDHEGQPGQGLAAFDPEGMPLWTLPVRRAAGPPGDAHVEALQIAPRRNGTAGLACAGTYRATVAIGGASLSAPNRGLFMAEVDRGGSVVALRGVPRNERRTSEDAEVVDLSLAAGTHELWVGGTMSVYTSGAWLQAVAW
jgi:hypothetical protein